LPLELRHHKIERKKTPAVDDEERTVNKEETKEER
jgi:hypothetical protein